jgi:hypothetical protein
VRIGNKTGTLLGEATVSDSNMAAKEIPLTSSNKKLENIVFVFKNEIARDKPLFAISKIEFKK